MNEESTERPVEIVLVYGNARRGGPADSVLACYDFLEGARARGRLLQRSFSPVLIPGGKKRVTGELYQAAPGILDTIREIEFGDLGDTPYLRKVEIEVVPFRVDVKSIKVWTWVWSGPEEGLRLIDGGDWKHREAPWFTAIAAALLAFFVFSILLFVLGDRSISMGFGVFALICWIFSPAIGLASLLIAGRRHERKPRLRSILRPLMGLAFAPSGLMFIYLLRALFDFLGIA